MSISPQCLCPSFSLPLMVTAILLIAWCAQSQAEGLPSHTVPDGLGINIHFTGAPARDLDMIQAAGFKFIRMDVLWNHVEKEKGVYDFSGYDELTDALEKRGIRPLYILCYSNPLYETYPTSIATEEGRKAFTRFAAETVKRYRNRGVIWEFWNEPDQEVFWDKELGVDGFMVLAKEALPAIRQADPLAFIIAPALWNHWDFLESCLQQGLLPLIDGVSIHPYREEKQTEAELAPENAVNSDYAVVRSLIMKYQPERPNLPIISSEWGYTNALSTIDPSMQGRFLSRSFLLNLSHGITLSIWYDWKDDGTDPKEVGHNYGTVTTDYNPKPAYLEMQRLTKALSGMHYVKRLESASNDYLLLFADAKKRSVAAWTTGEPHEVQILPNIKDTLDGYPKYLGISGT